MPKILTMTRLDGESDEDFAARIAEQSSKFFGNDTPTDEPADSATPQEGPASSA